MRKLLNWKIIEEYRKYAICHEEFTDYNDVVRDHKDPKGMGGATPAASDDRCLDVPAGPNSVKRSVEFVPQADERRNRHSLVPLCPQSHDHFRKPSSLRVARSISQDLHVTPLSL